jgi:uncharacterized protein YcbK (DUF882 family)
MLPAQWSTIKRFRSQEFDDPTMSGSGQHMEYSIVKLLDSLREAVGTPIHIASGYRTPEHNASVGGVEHSAHMTGHAADISTTSLQQAITLAAFACMLGARRVGVDLKGHFVHIDTSPYNPSPSVWFYNAT